MVEAVSNEEVDRTLEEIQNAMKQVRIRSARAEENLSAASASVEAQKAIIREAAIKGSTGHAQ